MIRAGVLMVVAAFLAQQVVAQEEREPLRPPVQQFLFYEAINLVSADSTRSRVDIHYRIDADFFVPIRNSDPSITTNFKRRGEILIELIDSLGTSQARDINHFEVGTASSEPDPEAKKWYLGIVSFTVPPGPYNIVFDVDDLESERKYLNRDVTIRATRLGDTRLEASTPLFIYQPDSGATPSSLVTQSVGGNLLFGKKSALFFQLASPISSDSSLWIEYSFSISKSRFRDTEPVLTDTARDVVILPQVIPEIKRWSDSVGYNLSSTSESGMYNVIVPLSVETLPLRPYDLLVKVRRGSSETEITKSFQMIWPDMPLSLRDIDYALDALNIITREEQLDSLKRGDFEARRSKLEAFWKEKDKTPETSYNEVMAEFYRRVDHARKTFGTLREPDGFKSDRGRVFVLYGPPTKIERTLDAAAGFRESWSYEKLNKKFVFLDKTKSGIYMLVSTQSL